MNKKVFHVFKFGIFLSLTSFIFLSRPAQAEPRKLAETILCELRIDHREGFTLQKSDSLVIEIPAITLHGKGSVKGEHKVVKGFGYAVALLSSDSHINNPGKIDFAIETGSGAP